MLTTMLMAAVLAAPHNPKKVETYNEMRARQIEEIRQRNIKNQKKPPTRRSNFRRIESNGRQIFYWDGKTMRNYDPGYRVK